MGSIDLRTVQIADGSNCVIRTAGPEDATETLKMYQSVVAEGRLTLIGPEELHRTIEEEAEAVRDRVKNPQELQVVAEVDGRIVGTATVEGGSTAITSHFGDIANVWVRSELRGLGIGGYMMSRSRLRSARLINTGLYMA